MKLTENDKIATRLSVLYLRISVWKRASGMTRAYSATSVRQGSAREVTDAGRPVHAEEPRNDTRRYQPREAKGRRLRGIVLWGLRCGARPAMGGEETEGGE